MPQYIDFPVDSDPQDILADAYSYLQAVIPGWTPAQGNLDVWLLEAVSTAAAELKDVASAVPTSIFRWFGANLVNVPPIDATPATGNIKVTVQDAAGYTIPDGMQVSIDFSGDTTVPFTVVGDHIIPPGSTFVDNVPITAVDAGAQGSGLGSVNGVVHLLDPLSFVTAITQDNITSGGVDAESDVDYLNRLAAELQLLTPRPILPNDFAVLARTVAGVYRATAIDGYNPFHNLLSANDASLETSVAGYAAGANSTIARSVAQAADGVASLGITSVAAGGTSAVLVQADQIAVTPGETITAVASFRAATVGRNVQVGIAWYTAGNVFISTALGAAVADVATGFLQASVTAVAPATAAFARINPIINATGAAAELHYVDKLSMRRGTTTDWVPGGTGATGQPRMVTVAAVDQNGNPVSSAVKGAISTYLQSLREVNFVVNATDPATTQIDVTYQVIAKVGYDKPTLLTAINAAIASYLSAASWGTDGFDPHSWVNTPYVRYLELAALINNVDGVDYITTTAGNYDLTTAIHTFAMARGDILLPGAAPLPSPGTIVGTVL